MKKITNFSISRWWMMIQLFFIALLFSSTNLSAQTATLKIGTVYSPAGTVLVPVTLEAINNPITGNNLISSWSWYIIYDPNVLDVVSGSDCGHPAVLTNFNPAFPSANYLTNIFCNSPTPGLNTLAIIYSCAVSGVGTIGMKFFDIQFTYVGPPSFSNVNWDFSGKGYEEIGNKSLKFFTNMADDEGNEFVITPINGLVGSASASATLKIGTVNTPNLGIVNVPITLESINNTLTGNNLISSWSWYIVYDPNVLDAGPVGSPITMINVNNAFPESNYLTNIIVDAPSVGLNTIAIIYSSAVSGLGTAGMKFFDIQFNYTGGSDITNIIWDFSEKIGQDEGGKSLKFYTNMADDIGNPFDLTAINGSVHYDPISATLKIGEVETPTLSLVNVPITLEAINNPVTGNNLISSWSWYLVYDPLVLNAGIPGNPITMVNINDAFPAGNYVTNIIANAPAVGLNTIAVIYSATNSGTGIVGMKFFDIQFDYIGGLDFTDITWDFSEKIGKYNGGNSMKFYTNMADDVGNSFILSTINGSIHFTGSTYLNLKAFLEGPYENGQMALDLNESGVLPLTQPFNIDPWNYNGTENVSAIPNSNIVDWVLVELRESSGDASSAGLNTRIDRQACFINKDGYIVSIDGYSPLLFYYHSDLNLYAVIWHRNHLNIMSAFPLEYSNGIYNYDFTNSASKAYGGPLAQKEIAPGIWGMITADGNSDTKVDNLDNSNVWKPLSGSAGYKSSDYNMDEQIENKDKYKWFFNIGKSSQVPIWATCPGVPYLNYSGQTYNTLQIGNLCWLKENLNVGTMINGSNNQTNNSIIEKYCYSNTASNCTIYGGLYQWNEMMQYSTSPGVQGICPSGWHIPTDEEWCTTSQYIDPTVNCSTTGWSGINVGSKLKESGTSHWQNPNTGATNASGYTGLPGGNRSSSGSFGSISSNGYWWSSSQTGTSNSNYRNLAYNYETINRAESSKTIGYSVRCVKSITNQPPAVPFDPYPVLGATNVPTTLTISWSCTDPENDPLTYNVYFGAVNPPSLVSAGQTGSTFNPGVLINNTTYYWKIIAYDSYSNFTESPLWSFTTTQESVWNCGYPFLDNRDNQNYNTVQINNQCWMSENLNIGSIITTPQNQLNNGVIEKYCYNNIPSNCNSYGGIYQWNETMQYVTNPGTQGICPSGWHVPTDEEWYTMEHFLDPTLTNIKGWRGTDCGTKLKQGGISGFEALLSGSYWGNQGYFSGLDSRGWYMTSSLESSSYHYYRAVDIGYSTVYKNAVTHDRGYSVRCLKD